jgi:hypothetical protein
MSSFEVQAAINQKRMLIRAEIQSTGKDEEYAWF